MASLDFYKDLVAFAKKHEIFVLSDLAYAEVYFDDNPPPSMLQVPGAMDVTVEFTSMSKTFSMAGWRIGFAVGNERLLAALARVKSYLDYGAFTPVQVAAAAALNGSDDCIKEMRAIYKRRRDVMVESFAQAGWPIPAPRASMFAWAPVPERFRNISTLEFSKLLIEKADVAVAPGDRLWRTWRRVTCASRWSRTSSASVRRRVICGASSRRRMRSCTMSCRSPRGGDEASPSRETQRVR